MIDFRYHLVSIISVFLALAVGIVLGAGPLDQPIDSTVRQQARDATNASKQLRTDKDLLTSRLDHADSVLTMVGPAVVGEKLAGVRVSIVALPGTPGGALKDARDALRAAGATVDGSISLTTDWVTPTRSDDLSVTLAAYAVAGLTLPQGADGLAERAATQLAHAIVAPDAAGIGVADAGSEDLIKALRDRSFLRVDDKPWIRSSICVVLAPVPAPGTGPSDSAAVAEATRVLTFLLQVPRQISVLSSGTVVAGRTGSAGTNGLLSEVRGGALRTSVSTVDDLDSPEGKLALALAVVAERADETGHYGDGPDVDSPLPELPGITAS